MGLVASWAQCGGTPRPPSGPGLKLYTYNHVTKSYSAKSTPIYNKSTLRSPVLDVCRTKYQALYSYPDKKNHHLQILPLLVERKYWCSSMVQTRCAFVLFGACLVGCICVSLLFGCLPGDLFVPRFLHQPGSAEMRLKSVSCMSGWHDVVWLLLMYALSLN